MQFAKLAFFLCFILVVSAKKRPGQGGRPSKGQGGGKGQKGEGGGLWSWRKSSKMFDCSCRATCENAESLQLLIDSSDTCPEPEDKEAMKELKITYDEICDVEVIFKIIVVFMHLSDFFYAEHASLSILRGQK